MPELAARYNLQDSSSILVKQTPEIVIQGLCEVLNMVSPTGVHEHEFLRLVFPDYESFIPTHNYSSRNTVQTPAMPQATRQEMQALPPAAPYPAASGSSMPARPQQVFAQPTAAGFAKQAASVSSSLPPSAINIPASVPGNGQEQEASSIPGMTTELPSYSREDLLNRFKKPTGTQ
jgi:hypothetical protein